MSSAFILAANLGELPGQLLHILYYIVLPILLLAGVGYLLQRVVRLDMPTLRKLNFYFVIPCMIYGSVVTARVTPGDVGTVVLFALALLACMGVITYLACIVRRVPRDRRSAAVMTVIFHNSGNFGLPLQDLAFRSQGLGAEAKSLQAFVMITQNFVTFTLGIVLAASGGSHERRWRDNLMHIVKFPPVYALAAGVLTVQIRQWIGSEGATDALGALRPFWEVIKHIKGAFIAIALCTLGAQLALVSRGGRKYPVTMSVILRLLVGPAVGLGLIFLMGLQGFLAQMLLISTSSPTAVNCMMICLEFDNHPDYAAKAVFYSTLISPVTVTLVIFLSGTGIV